MSKRITQKGCLKFFQKVQDADGKRQWRCQGGKILKRQEGSGWTNHRMHLTWQHLDDAKQLPEAKLGSSPSNTFGFNVDFASVIPQKKARITIASEYHSSEFLLLQKAPNIQLARKIFQQSWFGIVQSVTQADTRPS